MIKKITSEEYLRRIDNMTFAEKDDYLRRVGEWIRSQARLIERKAYDQTAMFQNVLQISAAWNDDECRVWEEGARLLTALMQVSDTWLPDKLYTMAAKRTILQMIACLKTARKFAGQPGEERQGQPKQQPPHSVSVPVSGDMPQPVLPPMKHEPITHVTPMIVRPRHIDQYAHLLPEKTQEKAAQYGPLMRELDSAREKLRLLADDKHSSAKDREAWAKKIVAIDKQVKAIRTELDREWDNLVKKGGVVMDDLGNVRVMEPHSVPGTVCGMTEEEKEMKDHQRKAALLRKWLIDKRNAKTEKQKEKWLKKYREMVELGGEDTVTDKVRDAAKYYEVDLTACLSPCDVNKVQSI